MHTTTWPVVLGAIPQDVLYVNLFKIGGVVLLLWAWAAFIQWVDRDTDLVKTKRETWNVIVMSGGVAGFLVFIVPPWSGMLYFVGVGLFVLLSGGSALWYVIHRNGRVVASGRVMTIDHFKRLISGGKTKELVDDRGQQVRLADGEGKPIVLSTEDPEEQLDYYAAQDFLHDMLWRRASDVDMVRNSERYRVVHRVDGLAAERSGGVSLEEGERILRYLKGAAGLNAKERRKPQVGNIHAALVSDERSMGRIEIHTSGSTAGERMRLRARGEAAALRIHEIGMMPRRLETVKELIAKRSTMILLSSPRGVGLTTTMYAVVRAHDAYMNNIHALEKKPISDLDNITQHKYVSSESKVAYARTLQTVLRKEPDVVLVGECEDRETAQIAGRATEDRKIYMGIEATDTFEALSKYLALIDDNKLAARSLSAVLNQRLVRVLCTHCRQAFRPDPKTLKKLNLPVEKIERFYRPPTEPILDKKGNEIICQNCQGSGYHGRTGIFELLVVSDEVAKLIAQGASIQKIKSTCRRNKMYYLQEEGLFKVIDGTTSLNEILRCLRSNGK